MASGFYYKPNATSFDLLSLSAKCDEAMVGVYGTTLNAKKYCPDTTNLVKYTTSTLDGLWGNVLASYCNNFKVGTDSTGIAAKGCAPVPKRYNNGSHISVLTITAQNNGDEIAFRNYNGQLQYIITRNTDIPTSGAGTSWTSIGRTHIVIDVCGGGGGGSGGNTGANLGAHSRGGAGGGAGAWCSYLIDSTKFGSSDYLIVTLGSGGAGGACESNGSAGNSSIITLTGAMEPGIAGPPSPGQVALCICGGGSGAVGSNYWDGCGDAGSGGTVDVCISNDSSKRVKLLASGNGAAGGKGASVDGTHGSGSQGEYGPQSVSFGGLLNFTNVNTAGGSAIMAAAYNYDDFDERVAVGGGGGGSLFAPGGYGGGSMATYNTINKSAGSGTYGSGGGGSAGGKTISRSGGDGGPGTLKIYFET